MPTKEAIRLTKLWQKHGSNTYPIDIHALIDGALHNSDFQGEIVTKKGHFDSFEGCLLKTKNTGKWTILLNESTKNKRRLRFTYAHELGHFMCHRHMQDRFEDSETTLNDFSTNIEKEANAFASWLLMPANIIRDEFEDISWNVDSLRNIGNRFECSLQASALRFVRISSKPIAFVVSRDGIILWACKSSSAPYLKAYKFGEPLPENSHASLSSPYDQDLSCSEVRTDWNDYRGSVESQYYDSSGLGYQYTCIEFR